MNRLFIYGILLTALFLLGCSRKMGVSDVLGTYAANQGQTVDTLEIKKDGTYFYTCKLASTPDFANTAHWSNASPDTSDFTNEDHWELHFDDGQPRITLDHFRACAREYRRPPGFWDLPVERSWSGTIQLPIDSDVNYYWVKKNLKQVN